MNYEKEKLIKEITERRKRTTDKKERKQLNAENW